MFNSFGTLHNSWYPTDIALGKGCGEKVVGKNHFLWMRVIVCMRGVLLASSLTTRPNLNPKKKRKNK
jgi:hypothetical protein